MTRKRVEGLNGRLARADGDAAGRGSEIDLAIASHRVTEPALPAPRA